MRTAESSSKAYSKFIRQMTGCSVVTDPAFEWATDLPCIECGIVEGTAVVSFDDEGTLERLCYGCAVTR